MHKAVNDENAESGMSRAVLAAAIDSPQDDVQLCGVDGRWSARHVPVLRGPEGEERGHDVRTYIATSGISTGVALGEMVHRQEEGRQWKTWKPCSLNFTNVWLWTYYGIIRGIHEQLRYRGPGPHEKLTQRGSP
jgi:hypothetical protein